MAVVFGEAPDAEGWIKVTMIQYKIDHHEDGFFVDADDIPQYPESGMGVGWVQYYHPSRDEWKFEQIKVPYKLEETVLEVAAAIRELAQAIKER